MSRAARLLLVGLLLLNAAFLGASWNRVSELERRVEAVETANEAYRSDLAARNYSTAAMSGVFAASRTETAPVLVYDPGSRGGRVADLRATTLPGEGVYVRADGLPVERRMQSSFVRSVEHARSSARLAPEYGAVYLDVGGDPEWEFIGGRSAEVVAVLATAATDADRRFADDVAVTGKLADDGRVLRVSHVPDKLRAAERAGYDRAVVPDEQVVDVEGIEVVGVETVEEAADVALVETNVTATATATADGRRAAG